MENKKLKGFTLVEVLIIVSIIVILGTVVLYEMWNSEKKSIDTKIMAMVDSMMTAAQANASVPGGSYYDWMMPDNKGDIIWGVWCSWANIDTSYQKTCNKLFGTIYAAVGDGYPEGGTTSILYVGNQVDPTSPGVTSAIKGRYLSIMAWLPYARKYYCKGSNGKSSADTTANGESSGCGRSGDYWACPGCVGDVVSNP